MRRRIPSLNWLRVFEAAARHQSFARAAEELHMSAAAVSQQVKSLEAHFGQPLFTRGTHEVRLTAAARAFVPTVSDALNSVDVRAATLFSASGSMSLTVQATQVLATSWMASQLPNFRQRYPETLVNLVSDSLDISEISDDVELKIVFGAADLGWAERDRLFGERLFPVATAAICREIESGVSLVELPLIEIADHRAGWFRFLDAAGIRAEDATLTITDRTDLALSLAASGYGIALARAPATDAIVKQFGLERCLEPLEVAGVDAYHLTYRNRGDLSPAAQSFRSWLLERVAADRS